MCHFDQICTNNLSPYSETGKEGKREPGPEGKWVAESAGFSLHDDNMFNSSSTYYMPCSVLSILHVSFHSLLTDLELWLSSFTHKETEAQRSLVAQDCSELG